MYRGLDFEVGAASVTSQVREAPQDAKSGEDIVFLDDLFEMDPVSRRYAEGMQRTYHL